MARIRSIHPNTPTDPEFASLPVEARLLFIYSWTIADDAGNLEGNPLGLRMALFPGDDWATVARITELVEMLTVGRFLVPFEADGKRYLHVRNFGKYQKLDHPTAPKFPLAPGQKYVYHVRQGNTFQPRTENGPPLVPEQHTNGTLTAHERSGNVSVPFSQEWNGSGLEGKGKDWTGTEGRGPGREGTADAPPPPFEGDGGAASKDNGNGSASDSPAHLLEGVPPLPVPPGNGQSVGEGKDEGGMLAWTESLSLLKRESLQHAVTLAIHGERDEAIAHVKGAGFEGPDLARAVDLLRPGGLVQ